MTEPGWYQAAGDPPGTQRWWDGQLWIGDPVPIPTPAGPDGFADHGGYVAPPAERTVTPTSGARIGARIIDLVMVTVLLCGIVMMGVGTPEFSGDRINVDLNLGTQRLDAPLEYVLWGIMSFAWSAVWIIGSGATMGKRLLKMEIVMHSTGESVSAGVAALRSANKLLPIAGIASVDTGEAAVLVVGTLLIGLPSLIMLLTNSEGRTVMDQIAGTRVVLR